MTESERPYDPPPEAETPPDADHENTQDDDGPLTPEEADEPDGEREDDDLERSEGG